MKFEGAMRRRVTLIAAIGIAAIVAAVPIQAGAQQPRPSGSGADVRPKGDDKQVDACANAAEESQALRKDGKLTQARERLVVCARATCPSFIQKDCAMWLAEVDKSLPSVVLRATDPKGKDVTKVRVLVDGRVMTEKLDGRPLSIDPGEHTFTFEAEGQPPVTETILIRQGETNRLVTTSFAKPTDPTAPPPPPTTTTTPPGEKSGGAGIPTVSWILGGAGIVLGGVGAGLWISGKGDHSSMESGCATTRSCSQDDVDSAQTRLLIGDVAIGAGLVALGAAIVLAFVSKGSPSSSSSAASTTSTTVLRPLDRGFAIH